MTQTMVEVPADTLAALQARLEALEAQAAPRDPLAAYAEQFASIVPSPPPDTMPRSHPLGYEERASPEMRARMRVAERAKMLGGRRPVEPEYQSIYGHRPANSAKRACPALTRPTASCDGNCWTPDVEKRELIAVGLPYEGDPPPPLDKPEARGSQAPQGHPTIADARKRTGRTPSP